MEIGEWVEGLDPLFSPHGPEGEEDESCVLLMELTEDEE